MEDGELRVRMVRWVLPGEVPGRSPGNVDVRGEITTGTGWTGRMEVYSPLRTGTTGPFWSEDYRRGRE